MAGALRGFYELAGALAWAWGLPAAHLPPVILTSVPCLKNLRSPQELEVTLFSPDIWLAGERTGLGWHPPERPSSSGTQAPSIFVWTESLPDPLGVQNTGDGSSREGTEDSSVFGTPEEVATGRKLQTGSPPGVP